MKRLIYNELIKWKNNKNKKPLMVYGARQVGKTYIIEEFCKNEYNNYIKLDLKKNKGIVDLFNSNNNFDDIYEQFKLNISDKIDIEDENSIIFFDEIQICKELIGCLKYFCEDHNNVNIICAGSLLGTMLSREAVFAPVGKVWELTMYSMNFEEFLMAVGKENYISRIKDCFEKNKKMGQLLHDEIMKLYKVYLFIGGMPESVQDYINSNYLLPEYNENIVSNIIKEYIDDMNQYVISSEETMRIREIYDNIGNQLGNNSHKFQPSKIDKNKRLASYASAINWLYTSRLILRCYSISLPEIPLKAYTNNNVFKLYANDPGILSNIVKIKKRDVFDLEKNIYSGVLAENYTASQLTFNEIPLYYWLSNNEAEVDFILDIEDGIIPLEIKSGNNTKAKSLKVYMEKYKPKYAIRASSNDFSYDDKTKIKDIPLYAIFCIK